jgi:hypothetical protein
MRAIEDIIEELKSLGVSEETTNEIDKIVSEANAEMFDMEEQRDEVQSINVRLMADKAILMKRIVIYQEAMIDIATRSKSITDTIKRVVEEDKKYE